MEEEGRGRGEDGFKARKGGARTHLLNVPCTFRDEETKYMMPSCVSSRAMSVCFGWAHKWELLYLAILLFLFNNSGSNLDQEENSPYEVDIIIFINRYGTET